MGDKLKAKVLQSRDYTKKNKTYMQDHEAQGKKSVKVLEEWKKEILELNCSGQKE